MAMTGKGFDVDSDFLHLKKRGMSCEGVDRISELPDEIISHIVSFLPLKDAVATSILSPRWSSLWKYTPNLVFVDDPFLDPMINIPIAMPFIEGQREQRLERSLKNVAWVNSVLNSYKVLSLKQFTLSLHVRLNTFDQVSKWLHFAFSRRVEILKLNLEWSPFVLDVNILNGIQSSDYGFLRELTLQDLEVSGEAIEILLRSCSVLERLIMNATLMSDVVIGGSLKYLEINPVECIGKFIKVSAPNLTRLIKCSYEHDLVLLENVPNLVEASFHLHVNDRLMLQNAKLEVLTITLNRTEVFEVPPQMPTLKKLVVDYALVNINYMLPITCLLEASPFLEEFTLEVSDIDEDYHGVSSIYNPIFEVPEVGGFPHKHLKVFEFVGFCGKAADHVALVRYIRNNCVRLEEIVITPISAPVSREFELRYFWEWEYMKKRILAKEVDVIAEKQEVLEMKKSTEDVLAGKLPDRIKLLVN